jgi:hypothetical protein
VNLVRVVNQSLWGADRLGHPLHGKPSRLDVDNRDARNLSDPALQVLITGGNNETLALGDELDDVVVRVVSLGGDAPEPRILGQPQGNAKLGAQLLELGNHARRHARDDLGQQTVHQASHNVQLVLHPAEEVAAHITVAEAVLTQS